MAIKPVAKRMVIIIVGVALVWAPSVFAGKKLNESDKRWLEQEVGALITEDESQLFKDLDSDEEREVFKQIFWARRDPTPATSTNEFREDYEVRSRSANRNFKAPGRVGAGTDMGKIFLLLGAPVRSGSGRTTEFDPSGDQVEPELEGSTTEQTIFGSDTQRPAPGSMGGLSTSETLVRTWLYEPNEALGIPDGLTVRFRAQPGFGYRLMSSKALEATLEKVKELYIANPDITYEKDAEGRLAMPTSGMEGASSLAADVLMALRDTAVLSSDINFSIQPAFFRADEGDIYAPLLYEIDAASLHWEGDRADATFMGLVEDDQGNPLFQFEESATLTRHSDRLTAFEMPLQLQPGRYTLYLGVRDNRSSKLGTQVEMLDVPSFDGGEFELSTILLFSEGGKSDDPFGDVGRAFVIGGYRFIPKLGSVYEKTDRFSGVFNAYGYGIEDGSPNLTAQYIFLKDGVRRGQTQDEPFISQTETAAITVFDMPLGAFEPGDYTLRIQVTDHVQSEVLTEDINFVLK